MLLKYIVFQPGVQRMLRQKLHGIYKRKKTGGSSEVVRRNRLTGRRNYKKSRV